MSYPVSFRDFGSSNEELYRKYVSAWSFRECIAHGRAGACYDRFGRAAGRAGADSLGGVGGATIGWLHERRRGAGAGGFGRERGTLEWRPTGSGGDLSRGADGAARASGLGVDGGESGSSEAPVVQLGDGGSRGAPGSGGDSDVSSSDHTGGAGGDAGGTRASGAVTGPTRGKNYEKNKARRERAKASRSAGNVSGRDKTLVSVRAAHPQLDETWAERKIVENQVATAQLRAKLAKMEKEQQDGTAEKRYKVEANLVQGQLDGAFALVPQQRVVSWAKTIVSGSSGSSKTGASGKKTVASISSAGSRDASSASSVTVAEKRLTEENAKLRKQLSTARADCEKKIEKIEEVERMKRLEMGNGIERRLMELEEEVQRRDKKLKNYELYTGLRL